MRLNRLLSIVLSGSVVATSAAHAHAAAPSAEAALRLTPIQKNDVEYDVPTAAETKECTVRAETEDGRTGWVVRNAAGQILRKFSDNNKDNVVDRWSYFKDGLEVYCDIDANFNGKADNYRWFHTGGTRWGVDKNEDGEIDSWKIIAAEEVAAEIIAALRDRDSARFARLLATDEELDSLGVGDKQSKEIATKLAAARSGFRDLAARQRTVTSDSEFASFGGSRPGIVPAGTEGSSRDLVVYENVGAVVETGGKHQQVFIGTLIRSGNVWRLIDLPRFGSSELAGMGYFFRASVSQPPTPVAASGGPSEETQQMMNKLAALERSIAGATPALQSKLNAERSDLLEKLANDAEDADSRRMWQRQLADTLSAAVQTGTYPDGMQRLETLEASLAKSKDTPMVAYTKFRRMSAAYSMKLQDPKADFAKIQEGWLADLAQFVEDYPSSDDSAEAILQLAIAEEFSGDESKAKAWYARIIKDFPQSEQAKKATGARRRLDCVGKSITLRGTSLASGRTVDLAQYRGKMVLIQYWATWCEPCKADMSRLKELLARYGRTKKFAVIGVNLDHETDGVTSFLRQEKLPWDQLYEPGGLESRLANEMGILTLPTMILVGKDGRVISRNIHVGELENELRGAK